MSDINVSTQYSCPISTRGRIIHVRFQREHAPFMSSIITRTHHSCPMSTRERTIHVRYQCKRENINVRYQREHSTPDHATFMSDINASEQHSCPIWTWECSIYMISTINVSTQHLYTIIINISMSRINLRMQHSCPTSTSACNFQTATRARNIHVRYQRGGHLLFVQLV